MEETKIKVYGYRWLVLLAFVMISLMTQVLWITFAPITSVAAKFYNTSDLMIGLLSMTFMVVYILMFLPSAWVIDTRGFKAAVGIGAVLSAVFGLSRGIFASNFTLVFLSQVGIAAGQPFVLGSITKVAARWFPVRERATASGLGTLALYLGPLAAMLLSPFLVLRIGLPRLLMAYGIAAAAAAIVFLIVAREHPPTPAGRDERILMLDGLKSMIRKTDCFSSQASSSAFSCSAPARSDSSMRPRSRARLPREHQTAFSWSRVKFRGSFSSWPWMRSSLRPPSP